MNRPVILVALAFGLLFACGQPALAQGGAPPASALADPAIAARIEPALLKTLLRSQPGDHIPIIVDMRQPLQALAPAAPAAPDRATLVAGLQATAARSQAAVQAYLANEAAAGKVTNVRSFWIFNGLALGAVPETIQTLAARPDVDLVRLDHYLNRLEPASPAAASSTPPASAPAWGVVQVGADRVWSAFQNTGQGIVVATMDSGVDFMHPALQANYRGNAGKNLYQHTGNWFDATPDATTYPYDGDGHGTHTMGILAGQDGIGVAPGARWIAARVLDGQGYGYDSWIHAGFQWVLAPAGDPTLAPRILSNSWGSPVAGSTEFQTDLIHLRQGGIVVFFSAGNYGPGAGTVGSPAALPEAFAVGATDSDDEVPPFSSRGPSPWNAIKPQVAAPGVNIPSSVPGGVYATLSGTSMAAPHVAGVAALMLAAQPRLTVAETEYALTSTAVSRAAAIPNNDVGWGRIDAYAAVQAVAGAGRIAGQVSDASSRLPLAGAYVTVTNETAGLAVPLVTDAGGHYELGVAAGSYRVTGRQFGYQPATVGPLLVSTGTLAQGDIALPPLPVGVLRGVITNTVSGGPATATVTALGTPVAQTATGQYQVALPAGTYTVQARGLGYRVVTATVTVTAGQVSEHSFGLQPSPRILLVNSGAWYYDEYPGYFRQALDDLAYTYDERRIKHPLTDTPVITDLLKYDLVVWSSPQDSPGMLQANNAITRYLSSGKSLLLTGQDVAFWDGGGALGSYASYLHNYLKTDYRQDDAGTRDVRGLSGDLMHDLQFTIAGGDGANDQTAPDEIAVANRDYASEILHYPDSTVAGTKVGLCLPYRGVVLPFGFEAIATRQDRREVMRRALDYLSSPPLPHGLSLAGTSAQLQVGLPGSVVTYTARARNTAEVGQPIHYRADVSSGGWPVSVTPTEFTLAPCASRALTISATIPPGQGIDRSNPLTLTVQPLDGVQATQTITLTAKTPAPVLLVDHQRWYDVQSAYVDALHAAGVTFDTWTETAPASAPGAARLQWYPLVVWFTGYDWYEPLAAHDEQLLGSYLNQGGGLFLSSPFYLDLHGDSAFARDRLGVLNARRGFTATLGYGSPGHPLGTGLGPVDLVNPYPQASIFTLDPALVPSALSATAWRGDHGRAQAIARADPGNHVIFWNLPVEALPPTARAAVLGRGLGWLGPLGASTVRVQPQPAMGQAAPTISIVLRNKDVARPVSMRVELPGSLHPDPAYLPPDLIYDPKANALYFRGDIGAGEARTYNIPIATAGSASGWQTGRVVFRDELLGVDFDQPLQVGLATPDLSASSLQAGGGRSGEVVQLEMLIHNQGKSPATSATVLGLPPFGSQVMTGTIRIAGSGAATSTMDSVTWHGDLPPGAQVSIQYQIRLPLGVRPVNLPVEMLAWDGVGGAWEWGTWLNVRPYQARYPFAPH